MKVRRAAALLLGGLIQACSSPVEGPVLLVTSGFTDEVLLVDPVDGHTIDTRLMDVRPAERDEPHSVAVAPDGRHWYATLSHGDATLWKYESEGDRLVGRVPLGLRGAGRIGISPDSRTAIVPDYWLGGTGDVSDIVRVNLEELTVGPPRAVCPAPHDAQWSPDGTRVALTCALSDEVVMLDGGTLDEIWRRAVLRQAASSATPRAATPGNPLTQPMNLVWAPDGSGFFVTLMRSGEVVRFDSAGEEVDRVVVGGGPTQLAITPDGDRLVIALRADFAVAVVDVATMTLSRRVTVPDVAHPHGVALSPDGLTAFISHEGTTRTPGGISAIDLVADSVLWSREAGLFNLGIAWRPSR